MLNSITAYSIMCDGGPGSDDRAVHESLDRLLQSPQAQAIMTQGADVLRQKELEEQRLAQEREVAMQLALSVAQNETRSGFSR